MVARGGPPRRRPARWRRSPLAARRARAASLARRLRKTGCGRGSTVSGVCSSCPSRAADATETIAMTTAITGMVRVSSNRKKYHLTPQPRCSRSARNTSATATTTSPPHRQARTRPRARPSQRPQQGGGHDQRERERVDGQHDERYDQERKVRSRDDRLRVGGVAPRQAALDRHGVVIGERQEQQDQNDAQVARRVTDGRIGADHRPAEVAGQQGQQVGEIDEDQREQRTARPVAQGAGVRGSAAGAAAGRARRGRA